MRWSLPLTRVALCLSLLLPGGAAAASPPPVFDCGSHWRLTRTTAPLPTPVRLTGSEAPAATGTQILLNAGPGLTAEPAALAAWQRAVDTWESWLADDVTVVINADLQSLGEGILGGTNLTFLEASYDVMRDAMVADADTTDSLALGLPTYAQVNTALPPGWTLNGDAVGAKANLRALGFDVSADPNPDAEIIFNTDFLANFDFDASDGIDSTKYDFEAVALHELGHALGFSSQVDVVDLVLSLFPGFPGSTFIGTLDFYRLRPGDGALDFTLAPRVVATGLDEPAQVLYTGAAEYAMSTGAQTGDGYQSSHWAPDEITGTYIGLMDPTIAPGVQEEITAADLRALSLIGWDTVPDCDGDGIPGGCDPVVAVGDGFAPPALPLRAYPNPFRAGTTVLLRLAEDAPVRVSVHDVLGREVALLAAGTLGAGEHPLSWDGRDASGTSLPAGVYAVRARVGEGARTLKMLRLP